MPSQAMPGGGSMMVQGGSMSKGGLPSQTELKITDAQLPLWNTFAHERDIAVSLTLERREFSRTQSPRCTSGRLVKTSLRPIGDGIAPG
jgi:hypothetical protein